MRAHIYHIYLCIFIYLQSVLLARACIFTDRMKEIGPKHNSNYETDGTDLMYASNILQTLQKDIHQFLYTIVFCTLC